MPSSSSPSSSRRNPLLVFALLISATASVSSVSAHARSLAIVPRVTLRARAPVKIAAGSKGTLAFAAAEQERKRKKRPQTEGTLPARNYDGTCASFGNAMVNIDARFCIDRYEASVEEVLRPGRDDDEQHESGRLWPSTHVLDAARHYRAVSVANVLPQAYVSGEQAEAACKASNKRLCNGTEWRFACAGSQGTVYPYGPSRVEKRCNDYGHAPMYVFYPRIATEWQTITNAEMNDPRLNLMEGTLAKTGEHKDCVNDWGLYDMVGNVHEWTSDPHGTFQGGYYLDAIVNGEGCAYRTSAHDFDYHDYSTGFRCCADLRAVEEDTL